MDEAKPVREDGESDNEYSNRKGKWEARRNEARKREREEIHERTHKADTPLVKFKRVWGD